MNHSDATKLQRGQRILYTDGDGTKHPGTFESYVDCWGEAKIVCDDDPIGLYFWVKPKDIEKAT